MILTEKQVSQSEYSQKWRGADRELFPSFFSLFSHVPLRLGLFWRTKKKKKRYTLDVIRFCFKKILLSSPYRLWKTNEKKFKTKNNLGAL